MNCQRTPAFVSGCAFALPDLTVGSQVYTMSVRLQSVNANDTLVDWGIYNSYTGDA